jgi:hypothetical protein
MVAIMFFINHIPGAENIAADAFSQLVKPHVSKSHQLNIITEEEVVPAQTGPIDKHDAAGIALRSVREEVQNQNITTFLRNHLIRRPGVRPSPCITVLWDTSELTRYLNLQRLAD